MISEISAPTLAGQGSPDLDLSSAELSEIVAQALQSVEPGERVLAIIPDKTRDDNTDILFPIAAQFLARKQVAQFDALVAQGAQVRRVILIGGGARSGAVRRIAPAVFAAPVLVPLPGEYVADGAARQAAWTLAGGPEPPQWTVAGTETYEADHTPGVRRAYAEARDLVLDRAD